MDTAIIPSPLTDSNGKSGALVAGRMDGARAINALAAMPGRNKLGLALGALLLAGLAASAMLVGNEPDWRPLYTSMNDRDGGAVLAALTQMNVPHKFNESGSVFMVPAKQLHEVRLKLATQGLPRGGSVGFEIMETQKFGVTQFQERLNFQRGLEGELARSVMALSAVQSARVHLALPSQGAFMREQQKPSASVLLTLYGGRTLERGQVAGIVHLVASSVPDLNTRDVSVIDQTGALLSQASGEAPNGLDGLQQQHVRQTEQLLASRILAIVEPIVGAGNVKAQVTAELDFTQSESTAELYGPNQGASPATIRVQQLSEVPTGGAAAGAAGAGAGGGAGGIPGALSNQAPGSGASPINGGGASLAGGAGSPGGVKRDASTTYEVDKTVRVVRNATGSIKRLSAAVIVNHAGGADGKPALKPLPEAQMTQINTLVRDAIGFSKDRGDSVNVINAPFSPLARAMHVDLPVWRQPETLELARTLAPWVALPLLALVIIFGLVRPALRASRQPTRMLAATVEDALSLPVPLNAPALALAEQQKLRDTQLDAIRLIARENPATVANVVRTWINQPAA